MYFRIHSYACHFLYSVTNIYRIPPPKKGETHYAWKYRRRICNIKRLLSQGTLTVITQMKNIYQKLASSVIIIIKQILCLASNGKLSHNIIKVHFKNFNNCNLHCYVVRPSVIITACIVNCECIVMPREYLC